MIMSDDDLDHMSHEPVDENSLGFILSKALKSIDEVGGLDRAKLSELVGRSTYDMLLNKPRVADAIDAYLTASPQTKRAAGKMLSMHIARATGHGEVVDRIERELQDTFDPQPPSMKASPMTDTRTKPASRPAPTKRSSDLMELAKAENIEAYRRARMNPRGNQRQHRHGV
jgi:hypothetical protein